MLPLAFKLNGKRVVVIGAGRVAGAKIELLVEAGADVLVISPEVLVELPESVSLVQREYRAGDLAGADLVIAAVGIASVNEVIVAEAREQRVWLNVVDNPALCDFFFTAVHRDGPVTVSVSSEGSSPALAKYVRDLVARLLPQNLAAVAETLRVERLTHQASGLSTESRDWSRRVAELVDETAL